MPHRRGRDAPAALDLGPTKTFRWSAGNDSYSAGLELPARCVEGPYQVFQELPGIETVVCAERRGRLDDEDCQLNFDSEPAPSDELS